jgi:hypothetical protein
MRAGGECAMERRVCTQDACIRHASLRGGATLFVSSRLATHSPPGSREFHPTPITSSPRLMLFGAFTRSLSPRLFHLAHVSKSSHHLSSPLLSFLLTTFSAFQNDEKKVDTRPNVKLWGESWTLCKYVWKKDGVRGFFKGFPFWVVAGVPAQVHNVASLCMLTLPKTTD